MFSRSAGWLLLPLYSGFISHYFKENQMRALCGANNSTQMGMDSEPIQSSPVCKRCVKYKETKVLEKKRDRRIKYAKIY